MRALGLQRHIMTGRYTLPIAIILSMMIWAVFAWLMPVPKHDDGPFSEKLFGSLPLWSRYVINYLLYGLVGYLLIGLNNTFAFIRIRASVQTSIYLLLVAACPALHLQPVSCISSALFLIALYFVLHSYQQSRPVVFIFHSFLFLGATSLLIPQLMWVAPFLFWITAYRFHSLTTKSFCASIVGWCVPYWFLLGHAYFYGQMDLFLAPFAEFINLQPIQFDFNPRQIATTGYLFVLFLCSAAHCFTAGHQDSLRARYYLNALILITFFLLLFIVLQPGLGNRLLPTLFIGESILAGHFVALSGGRSSNLLLTGLIVALIALMVFNFYPFS